MPDYNTITIQEKQFKVPYRYKEGDVLKANEASALNQTFHENLRNNFASKVREGVEAGVSDEVLQQQLDDYANDYSFGTRTGTGGFRGDPVRTAAMGYAREVIRAKAREKNLELDAAAISKAATMLLDNQGPEGSIWKLAKAQVEAEKAAAAQAMQDVNAILDGANGGEPQPAAA